MPYPYYRNRYTPSVRSSGFNRMPVVSPKRKMVWARFEHNFTDASTAQTLDLLSDWRTALGITQNLPGYTVVRIRAAVQMLFNFTAVSDDTGIIHAVYVDTTSGIAADPQTAPNEDWLFWEWSPFTKYTSAGVADTDIIVTQTIDTKSMRKFEEINQTVWYSWAVTGASTTISATIRGSMLLKLP